MMNASRQLAGTPVRLAACAVMLVVAAAASGCGSLAAPSGSRAGGRGGGQADGSAAPQQVSASPSATAAAPGQPGRTLAACASSELKVTLDSAAAGSAAGSSYVPLEFTNASASACTLSGYPAVSFASGAAGPQIGTSAATEQSTRAAALTLTPGAVAHAWLQIADVASYPAGTCKPVQASGLRVGFAGTQPAAFLAHAFQACQNATPGSSVLAVFPVQAGRATRGTAP
jgi:hypothetical protein